VRTTGRDGNRASVKFDTVTGEARKLTGAAGAICQLVPELFEPQQRTVPSSFTAHT
jgi:hypothetical protein